MFLTHTCLIHGVWGHYIARRRIGGHRACAVRPPFGISDHCSPTPSVVWCHVVVVGGRGTSNLTKLTKKRRYALSMSYLDGTGRRMAGARLGIEMLTLGNRGQVKRRVHACTHARTHVRPPPKKHTQHNNISPTAFSSDNRFFYLCSLHIGIRQGAAVLELGDL
jgi:hypothetical protein